MMFSRLTGIVLSFAVVVVLLSAVGCGQKEKAEDKQAKAKDGKGSDGKSSDAKAADGKKELKGDAKHDSWWCEEHGVPEGVCSLCSDAVAAKCKKEGDWCPIHDRAQSQCFKCDPSKFAKYEAMYEAKYGKKPPRPPESEFKKS